MEMHEQNNAKISYDILMETVLFRQVSCDNIF